LSVDEIEVGKKVKRKREEKVEMVDEKEGKK
jgi:hypothetical protein